MEDAVCQTMDAVVMVDVLALVRITSSSRGRLSFLIAFPRMTSERPFE